MLFQAEGVNGHARAAQTGRAPQHTAASRVVDVLLLAATTCVVLGQMVKSIVGEGGSCAIDRAAGDVAPGIIAAGVGLSGLVVTGCPQAVEPGQLVWMAAVTVEILR